ncbi:hypothetical protein ACFVTY_09045 [Streptomyces sp. NPDC058067]|uniref:hypothetical protein n=1 Tax=Streptomyces sp. NPDC058067 TaxID=3346324 RepID=UPI0036DFC5FB
MSAISGDAHLRPGREPLPDVVDDPAGLGVVALPALVVGFAVPHAPSLNRSVD